jgi:hypothetical protein
MDRQLLEDIFTTALEGGSNYWCEIDRANHKKVRAVVPRSADPYFSTALLTAILDHGVEIEVGDAENEGEVLGVLSAKTMEERLRALERDATYAWALEAEVNEEGDATSSDIIFQYLVIGEVWFN